MKNIIEFRSGLERFLNSTSDQNSCYKLIQKDLPDLSYDNLLNDLMAWLFDGYETISECFSTTLYQLKKNPDVYTKLMQEIKKCGFKMDSTLSESITYDRLQEMEYITMILKESLRIDSPLPRSLHYYAKEDITIAGVPIYKGALLAMTYCARHFDPEQWQEPFKYIPERFDPSSDYYFKPGTKTGRDPLAFIAFSNSVRR